MCWGTFSENETCSELGSQYFQTVLWNKTRQTGGEKKTKFPIDAGSEGHNACMTCCDQGHNKKYSLEYTNDWMKYGLSFYAMEYSKTSESVKYPVAQNTLHTLSIISYRISSASHCSLRTRIRHMHINSNLISSLLNSQQTIITWKSVQNFNREQHIPFSITTMHSSDVLHNIFLTVRTWCCRTLIPMYKIGAIAMNVSRPDF